MSSMTIGMRSATQVPLRSMNLHRSEGYAVRKSPGLLRLVLAFYANWPVKFNLVGRHMLDGNDCGKTRIVRIRLQSLRKTGDHLLVEGAFVDEMRTVVFEACLSLDERTGEASLKTYR